MIVCADARHIPLADESVQCIVTSPPYWGLRKYAGKQELIWGGAEGCEHRWESDLVQTGRTDGGRDIGDRGGNYKGDGPHRSVTTRSVCQFCGAWRGAFGLESTVEMYIAHSLEILRECRRVLRSDGVCFWNIGDCYSGSWGNYGARESNGLKPKDLVLMPARIALAAQADGWWVRSDIIWAKPNPMPESVTDRPTDSYEHILMLTKSGTYFWNADALSMEPSQSSLSRLRQPNLEQQNGSTRIPGKTNGPMRACFGGRNKASGYGNRKHSGREDEGRYIENGVNVRNVWVFSPQPYREAHFATFPEELPRRCILAATKPGDIVLDAFGGSGTTGRVAIELQRKPILLDLAYGRDYAPLAKKRTSHVQLKFV